MGYKSTTYLTRESAIEKYAELKGKLKRLKWMGQATAMSDYDLGNALDALADEVAEANNGMCFDNYAVASADVVESEGRYR